MKIATEKREINVYKFEFTYEECVELRRVIDEKLDDINCGNEDDEYKYYNYPFLDVLLEELWRIDKYEYGEH